MTLPTLPRGLEPGTRQFIIALLNKLAEMDAQINGLRMREQDRRPIGGSNNGANSALQVQQDTIAANTTLEPTDVCVWHVYNCTSACDLTLCTPTEGGFVYLANVGAQTLTIKDDLANTLCALTAGAWTFIPTITGTGAIPLWPTASVVFGSNGSILTTGTITVASTTNGFTTLSADGHFWETTTDNAGATTTIDTGTGVPPSL